MSWAEADAAHVVFNCQLQAMECRHCGDTRALKLPMTLARTAEVLKAYVTLHTDCTPPATVGA